MADQKKERLVLEDGGFSCVSDHAVKVAHMLSCAEAAYRNGTGPAFEVWHVLEEYMRGDSTADECIEIFHKEWPEAFPGLVEATQ